MAKTYVQLGKTGDILNILPMLWTEAQAGMRPKLMVAEEYAQLLEGVSYVEPLIYPGPAWEIDKAMAQAKGTSETVICTQVNGPAELVREHVYKPGGQDRSASSFQKEQWRVARRLNEWDTQPPLVFDVRNPEREAALLAKHWPKAKRVLLVHADGTSSPFPYRDLLLELVKHAGFAVVNLAEVKAERFFDLLALYEKATALVAIDSGPLHLARALPALPVFALANDRPLLWHGAAWRPNHHWYCRYHDFPTRAAEMMLELRGIKSHSAPFTILHLAEEKTDLPDWRTLRIVPGIMGRLGPPDAPEKPYLRDVLRMGLQSFDGWIAISRPGTKIAPSITDRIKEHNACFAFRFVKKADGFEYAPIADFFVARADWWRECLTEIPADLLWGKDYFWSYVLWWIFARRAAIDLTGSICREAPATTPTPEAGHHHSKVSKHNSDLCDAFVKEYKVTRRYPPCHYQVETTPIEGLRPFSYNPSIIEHNGFRLVASRYHPDGTKATALTLAQLDGAQAISCLDLGLEQINTRAAEDPKLFHDREWPGLSFVASSYPDAAKTVVRYTSLVNGKPGTVYTPRIGQNDFSRMEKNWIMWRQDDGLFVIYQTSPTQIVYRLEGEDASQPLETPGPHWAYGPIKGGTPPVEFEGYWLRFFHSTLDNDPISLRRRYFVGAYVMEKEPPFKVRACSHKPIIYGSELDSLKVKERPFHWKANVIFPGGALAAPGGFILAAGVNDCLAVLINLKKTDLNL